jgi:hypothetical protein
VDGGGGESRPPPRWPGEQCVGCSSSYEQAQEGEERRTHLLLDIAKQFRVSLRRAAKVIFAPDASRCGPLLGLRLHFFFGRDFFRSRYSYVVLE